MHGVSCIVEITTVTARSTMLSPMSVHVHVPVPVPVPLPLPLPMALELCLSLYLCAYLYISVCLSVYCLSVSLPSSCVSVGLSVSLYPMIAAMCLNGTPDNITPTTYGIISLFKR